MISYRTFGYEYACKYDKSKKLDMAMRTYNLKVS